MVFRSPFDEPCENPKYTVADVLHMVKLKHLTAKNSAMMSREPSFTNSFRKALKAGYIEQRDKNSPPYYFNFKITPKGEKYRQKWIVSKNPSLSKDARVKKYNQVYNVMINWENELIKILGKKQYLIDGIYSADVDILSRTKQILKITDEDIEKHGH